jgi:hypothetical protein
MGTWPIILRFRHPTHAKPMAISRDLRKTGTEFENKKTPLTGFYYNSSRGTVRNYRNLSSTAVDAKNSTTTPP